MNHGSLINLSLMDKIAAFFDIIPKIVYFLFAAFASGIDAMQLLVRKLAGLDTYYQTATGEAVQRVDPLTEFVYGIIGIGDSAYVYSGLSTVFWSLAIFGLIVLVVSTIVAIIKSHYNEDTETTNPWKYIYTAIKSVLTFAVLLVVVPIGMRVSSFLLRTVDNITAGQTSEDALIGIYGPDAPNIFKGENENGQEYKTYANYDFFGAQNAANSTTFGGMLFKASAYSCNRVRNNSNMFNFGALNSNGQIFGNQNCTAFSSLQTNDQKAEYVAMQIDYAFSNCLELNQGVSYSAMITASPARYWKTADIFAIGRSNVHSFSKYNVSVVWLFYDLWQFNFIVAFGGAITLFGLMISIILGLMTRLVKGAALFLVYPGLLGLAPLDNFKAFKSWGTTFMQQLLMAFGAIIGINILLLIVPYLNNLSFFDLALVDYIVNVVLLIAGLMMTKDFITMFSGFVGGADAVSAGDAVKAEAAKTLKTGAAITGKLGMMPVKAAWHGTKAVGRGVVDPLLKAGGKYAANIVGKVRHSAAARKANKILDGDEKTLKKRDKQVQKAQENRSEIESLITWANNQKSGRADRVYAKVKASGGSDEEAKKARAEYYLKHSGGYDSKDKSRWDRYLSAQKGLDKARSKLQGYDVEVLKAKHHLGEDQNGRLRRTTNLESFWGTVGSEYKTGFVGKKGDDGKRSGGMFGSLADAGKTLADGFVKSLKELTSSTGLDKLLGGTKNLIGDMFSTQWVKGGVFGKRSEKLEGDKLQKEIAKKQGDKLDEQAKATEAMAKAIKEGFDKLSKANEATTAEIKKIHGVFRSSGTRPPTP